MKKVKYLLFSALAILLAACPEPNPENDASMIIINNSNQKIIWCYYLQHLGDLDDSVPWGSESECNKYLIPPGTSYERKYNTYGAKYHLERGPIKYYLLNYDSVMTIPWERIYKERIILKEITFNSWEEMEACNFEIRYP